MDHDACFYEALGPPPLDASGQGCKREAPPQFAKRAADNQLAVAVRNLLEESGHLQVARLTVLVHKGVVLLRGTVSRYYFKQVAQAAALRVAGSKELRNKIAVNSQSKASA